VTISELSTPETSQEAVLAEISGMLTTVLDEYGLDDVEITMETSLHDDLELESIDLVTLAGQLAQRYGDRVNIAEYLAEKELDEVIALRVGSLVEYVVGCLRGNGSGES
jgi:acyl carrier protein